MLMTCCLIAGMPCRYHPCHRVPVRCSVRQLHNLRRAWYHQLCVHGATMLQAYVPPPPLIRSPFSVLRSPFSVGRSHTWAFDSTSSDFGFPTFSLLLSTPRDKCLFPFPNEHSQFMHTISRHAEFVHLELCQKRARPNQPRRRKRATSS